MIKILIVLNLKMQENNEYSNQIFNIDETKIDILINKIKSTWILVILILSILFVIITTLSIILLITGYLIEQIEYYNENNCTIIEPLVKQNLTDNYISIVKYNHKYNNSTLIAKSMDFTLEVFYNKYNYKINDTIKCYTSEQKYDTVYYYKTSFYSDNKLFLLSLGYSSLLSISVTWILSFSISSLGTWTKINNLRNHSFVYEEIQ